MRKFEVLFIVIAILALMMTGCAKKAVENQAQVDQPVQAQPEPQTAAPQPEPMADTNPQTDRMAELNRFLDELVYFDFDSAVLRSDAQSTLRDKAQWLEANRDLTSLVIEGHCDERGTDAYNMALGARRADAVKKFMVDMGLSPERFQTLSYGEERPVDSGHNEEAWSKNRRADFKVNQ